MKTVSANLRFEEESPLLGPGPTVHNGSRSLLKLEAKDRYPKTRIVTPDPVADFRSA